MREMYKRHLFSLNRHAFYVIKRDNLEHLRGFVTFVNFGCWRHAYRFYSALVKITYPNLQVASPLCAVVAGNCAKVEQMLVKKFRNLIYFLYVLVHRH